MNSTIPKVHICTGIDDIQKSISTRQSVYNCPMIQTIIKIKKFMRLLRAVDEHEGTFMLQIVDDSGTDTEKRQQLLLRVRD